MAVYVIGANGTTVVANAVLSAVIPPTLVSVSPPTGSGAGGTAITITGTHFVSGITVAIGGIACTSVVVVNATTITCVTGGPHATGAVDVVATISAPGGGPVTLTNGFTYTPIGNLVIYGNSLVAGYNATGYASFPPPPPHAFAQLLVASLPAGWTSTIIGKPGVSTATMLTTVQAEVDALIVPGAKNVFFFQEVHNDVEGGADAAHAEEHTRAILRGRQNAGYSVFSPTIAHVTGVSAGPLNAIIDSYNTWLRANYTGFSSALVEVATDTFMGDPTNLTYYDPDGTHWTDAGHARIASLISPYLTTVMALASVPPIPQFNFALPTLRARYGHQIPKVLGTWKDESTNGIDVTGTSSPIISSVNSLQCFLFDGVGNELSQPLFRLGATSYTVFAVVLLVAAGTAPMFVSLPPSLNELRCSSTTGHSQFACNATAVTDSASIVGDIHVLMATISSPSGTASIELFVDGVSIGTASGASSVATELPLFLGSRSGADFANAYIAEVVILDSVATSTERHNIGALLASTWGAPAGW